MTIRATVDGVAYQVDERRLAAMIRAHRRTVAAWDPDRALDEAALDEALTAEVRAFEAAEVQEPGAALCLACVGTGIRPHPAITQWFSPIKCDACGGTGRVPPCPHPEPLPWDQDPTCAACGEEP